MERFFIFALPLALATTHPFTTGEVGGGASTSLGISSNLTVVSTLHNTTKTLTLALNKTASHQTATHRPPVAHQALPAVNLRPTVVLTAAARPVPTITTTTRAPPPRNPHTLSVSASVVLNKTFTAPSHSSVVRTPAPVEDKFTFLAERPTPAPTVVVARPVVLPAHHVATHEKPALPILPVHHKPLTVVEEAPIVIKQEPLIVADDPIIVVGNPPVVNEVVELGETTPANRDHVLKLLNALAHPQHSAPVLPAVETRSNLVEIEDVEPIAFERPVLPQRDFNSPVILVLLNLTSVLDQVPKQPASPVTVLTRDEGVSVLSVRRPQQIVLNIQPSP